VFQYVYSSRVHQGSTNRHRLEVEEAVVKEKAVEEAEAQAVAVKPVVRAEDSSDFVGCWGEAKAAVAAPVVAVAAAKVAAASAAGAAVDFLGSVEYWGEAKVERVAAPVATGAATNSRT